MERYTIGKTRSLSPLTFEEIDADIICEDGKVYLEKRDEEGKTYKSLLERDVKFYKLVTSEKVEEQLDARQLFLYTSAKCNLKCPLCYEEFDVTGELSVDQLKEILKGHKNKGIILTGRESTCREDIFELIKVVSENNRAILVTNAVKLANYDYTLKLKESGVDVVMVSFNGFNDEVYRQMNGAALLNVKLKALENLKKLGIKTCVSLTLAKGLNDKEIREICDFCVENRSFIYQLRVRTSAPTGRHLEEVEQHCLSEMVRLFADQLQIPMEGILKEHAFWKLFVKEFDFAVTRNLEINKLVMSRVCSYNFTIRKDTKANKYYCLGNDIDVDAIARSRFKKPLLLYYFVKAFGALNIAQKLLFLLKVPVPSGDSDSLMVVLRCWPNVYTIDLEENKKCLSAFYKDGLVRPFCYSNIMSQKKSLNQP